MAKKVLTVIKLQISAGSANPAPPVGPALGQHGVNIGQFVTQFNEKTKDQRGMMIPVVISVFNDRSFTFEIKSPPAAVPTPSSVLSGWPRTGRLRPGTLRRLMGWRGLANVTKVELGNNTFDREAMAALLSSPHTRRLTTLHLGSGHIQSEALESLAHSTALARLRDVTVPADASEAVLAALRQRFGPRLAHDLFG